MNEYISLKLIKNNNTYKTQIFVNGEQFDQCKFLFLNVPKDKLDLVNEINSIDEAADVLDNRMESYEFMETRNRDYYGLIESPREHIPITPKQEFWAHCSNIQAWAENNYNTCLLHSYLSFPLLKKLTDVGDPIAKKVFKEEIAKRLESGYKTTVMFLINAEYINYLSEEELGRILENFDFSQYIGKKGEFWKEEFTTLYRLAEKSSIAKSVFKKELVRVLKDGSLKKINEYCDVFDVFEEFFTREEQIHALLTEQEADVIKALENLKNVNGQHISKFCLLCNHVSGSSIQGNAIYVKNGKIVDLIIKEPKLNHFPSLILKLKNLEYLYLSLFEKKEEYEKNIEEIKEKIKDLHNLKNLQFGTFFITF